MAAIVFLVRHYLQYKDLLASVQNASNEPELVSSDVEHAAVSNEVGTAKFGLDIATFLPSDGLAANVRVPRFERSFGILVPCNFPKLLQACLGNDPYPLLPRLSASGIIIVRETRTGKPKVRELRTVCATGLPASGCAAHHSGRLAAISGKSAGRQAICAPHKGPSQKSLAGSDTLTPPVLDTLAQDLDGFSVQRRKESCRLLPTTKKF